MSARHRSWLLKLQVTNCVPGCRAIREKLCVDEIWQLSLGGLPGCCAWQSHGGVIGCQSWQLQEHKPQRWEGERGPAANLKEAGIIRQAKIV